MIIKKQNNKINNAANHQTNRPLEQINQTNKPEQTNKPLEKWKTGNLDCTIWNNTVNKDNQTFQKQNISLRRSWKQNGEWKEQKISMSVNDIQKALLLLSKAQEYLLLMSPNNQNAKINDFD